MVKGKNMRRAAATVALGLSLPFAAATSAHAVDDRCNMDDAGQCLRIVGSGRTVNELWIKSTAPFGYWQLSNGSWFWDPFRFRVRTILDGKVYRTDKEMALDKRSTWKRYCTPGTGPCRQWGNDVTLQLQGQMASGQWATYVEAKIKA